MFKVIKFHKYLRTLTKNSNFYIKTFKSIRYNNPPKKIYETKESNNNDKLFEDYLENFESVYRYKKLKKNIPLVKLIQTQEYLRGNYYLLNKRWSEAEEEFRHLKNLFRADFMGSLNYLVVSRRLGISLIRQKDTKKIKEGLIEFENVYELSKDDEVFNYKYRLNARIDLLKAYIHNDPCKANYFADHLMKEEREIKLLDAEELCTFYHYIGVSNLLY